MIAKIKGMISNIKEKILSINIQKCIIYGMFILSGIFTTNTYIGTTTILLNKALLGSMGVLLECSKFYMIPMVIKFTRAKIRLWTIISISFLSVLIALSVFSNIQFMTQINNNKIDSTKVETKEYKTLIQNKRSYTVTLNELENDIKNETDNNEKIESELNQNLNQKNKNIESKSETISESENVWTMNQVNENYSENIKDIESNIETLQENKTKSDTKLDTLTTKKETISDKLEQVKIDIINTPKYERTETSIFNLFLIRIILGVIFEIGSIIFYFMSKIKELNTKKRSKKFKHKLEPKIVSVEHKLEPKIVSKGKKVVSINDKNVNQFYEYLISNKNNDGSIISDSLIIKNTGLSKRKIQEYKKTLLETGKLETREGTYKRYII